ncbi:MAG TPA: UdgX family uracil-DNA binding protein [Candidatus Dormibacteraeota bacterium]
MGKPVEELLPKQLSIPNLAAAAEDCQACDLHARATQTVFGEGDAPSTVMLVGEQPGDREDVEGRPFVGPAGRFLDSALDAAGIDRTRVYVTNIVKHFKWVARGKRRIHQSPNRTEVLACRPWLQAEILVVKPRIIVALGATAAKALIGSKFKVTEDRGKLIEVPRLGAPVVATVHPASILRSDDREAGTAAFIADLKAVARYLGS